MLRSFIIGITAALALTPAVQLAQEAARPNILLIFSDDHAQSALSAYGSKVITTPHLDRIASAGARFTRAFVTNSICTPSRATLLTGQYSHRNGVPVFNRFDGSRDHLAKQMQTGGYFTALVGKWHLGSAPTGFDRWLIHPAQGAYQDPEYYGPGGRITIGGHCTAITADLGIELLRQRPKEKPFFLMLHQKAPHRSWQPDARNEQLYAQKTFTRPTTFSDDYATREAGLKQNRQRVIADMTRRDLKLTAPANLTGAARRKWFDAKPDSIELDGKTITGPELDEMKFQRFMRDYLACVQGLDDSVGTVLDYLKTSGEATRTIVIYTSDNGWFMGEHGLFDKRLMYEPALSVPLLIAGPGVKPGITPAQFALNLDLAPTILDLAGLPVPSAMQGVPLTPLLRGETPTDWRESLYYRYYHNPNEHAAPAQLGVRTATHKLIHYWRQDAWEMFDLAAGPHELRNLLAPSADPRPAAVTAKFEELKRELTRLKQHYDDDGRYATAADLPTSNVEPVYPKNRALGRRTVAEAVTFASP